MSDDLSTIIAAVATLPPGSPPKRGEIRLAEDLDGIAGLAAGYRYSLARAADDVQFKIWPTGSNEPQESTSMSTPVRLNEVSISKPWGEELWFTGIEARGVSTVQLGTSTVPIPAYLAIADAVNAAARIPPILLKILAPHPHEDLGDLYFELHEHKQETYIVTGIDRSAWPSGIGAIRLGMNQARRTALGDANFRQQFATATHVYAALRKEVDAVTDQLRADAGIAADTVVPPDLMQQWLDSVPAPLQARVEQAAAACASFTERVGLSVGDVVRVPTLMPHALQHGVRVVEFQTPTYERKIISFNQKVLTQPHWDIDAAVAIMDLSAPDPVRPNPSAELTGVHVEEVAQFSDFCVLRVGLAPGTVHAVSSTSYFLALGLTGIATVDGVSLAPEQAVFVPVYARGLLSNTTDSQTSTLIAYPTGTDAARGT